LSRRFSGAFGRIRDRRAHVKVSPPKLGEAVLQARIAHTQAL